MLYKVMQFKVSNASQFNINFMKHVPETLKD